MLMSCSAGDIVDGLLAMMVVHTANKVDGGLPPQVLFQMYFWVFIDLVVGFVPFVGDVADAALKCNSRNAILLEDHLRKKGNKNLRNSGMPVPSVDPSDPDEFDRIQRSTQTTEYVDTQPGRHGHMSASRDEDGHRPQSTGVTDVPVRPSEARVHDSGRSGGGFFGFGGSRKSRPVDEEMGNANKIPVRK
jgi:hypothetical protein